MADLKDLESALASLDNPKTGADPKTRHEVHYAPNVCDETSGEWRKASVTQTALENGEVIDRIAFIKNLTNYEARMYSGWLNYAYQVGVNVGRSAQEE